VFRKYGELKKAGALLFEFVYRELSGKSAKDKDTILLNYTGETLESRFDRAHLFPGNERTSWQGVSRPDDGGGCVFRERPVHVQRRQDDFRQSLSEKTALRDVAGRIALDDVLALPGPKA
jgi:hypothetical protein